MLGVGGWQTEGRTEGLRWMRMRVVFLTNIHKEPFFLPMATVIMRSGHLFG